MSTSRDDVALVRLTDLTASFEAGGALRLRSTSAGIAARVPPQSALLLAFCSEPRTLDDVAENFGPQGAALFRKLAQVGFLVAEGEADATPAMFEGFGAIDVHRRMLADKVRLDAYADAIAQVVKPGMAVLDAGTGSGVLACLAALAGARVVYAVDRSELMDVAAETARRSGVDEQIRLIRGDFGTVQLPEPVDVIVTETFGALALAEGSAPDLEACVKRNLKPDGQVIPRGVRLHVAPVGARGAFDDAMDAFGTYRGVDLSALREPALGRAMTQDALPESLMHPGAVIADVPYPGMGAVVGGTARFEGLPAGELVGLMGWFTLDLCEGVELPTGPADPETHWKKTFLPLEPRPVAADATLDVEVALQAPADDRRALEVETRWRMGEAEGRVVHRVR